jgi:hypothetical protein
MAGLILLLVLYVLVVAPKRNFNREMSALLRAAAMGLITVTAGLLGWLFRLWR